MRKSGRENGVSNQYIKLRSNRIDHLFPFSTRHHHPFQLKLRRVANRTQPRNACVVRQVKARVYNATPTETAAPPRAAPLLLSCKTLSLHLEFRLTQNFSVWCMFLYLFFIFSHSACIGDDCDVTLRQCCLCCVVVVASIQQRRERVRVWAAVRQLHFRSPRAPKHTQLIDKYFVQTMQFCSGGGGWWEWTPKAVK